MSDRRGIPCPACGDVRSTVLRTTAARGYVTRRRRCLRCDHRFTTVEKLPGTPLDLAGSDICVGQVVKSLETLTSQLGLTCRMGSTGRVVRFKNPTKGKKMLLDYLTPQDQRAMECGLCRSAGLRNIERHFSPETLERSDEYQGLGLIETILQFAHRGGYNGALTRLDSGNLGKALECAFSTTGLSDVLSRAGGKFLSDGFARAPRRWRQVAGTASVNSLRQHSGYRLVGDGGYEEVPPSGELEHGHPLTEFWNIQAKTYGRLFSISREDLINDNLGVFDTLRTQFGEAAGRKLEDEFWKTWLAAASAGSFWAAANNNYLSGGTSPLGAVSLAQAVALFRKQRDADNSLLNLEPSRLIVPPELEPVGRGLYQGTEIGDQATGVFKNQFRPVIVGHLSDSNFPGYSTTGWWLSTDPDQITSAEVAFLNGQQEPMIEMSDADLAILGIKLRVVHDFGISMTTGKASVHSAGA